MVAIPPSERIHALEKSRSTLQKRLNRDIDFIRMQGEAQFLANSIAETKNQHGGIPKMLEMRIVHAEKEYEQYIRDATLHNMKANQFKLQMESNFASLPILYDRFQLIELLGISACNIELWRARDLQTMTIVAIHIAINSLMLEYEHKALTRLDVNRNLIRVLHNDIYTFNHGQQVYSMYVREYMEKDLQSLLLARPGGRIIPLQAKTIALRVAQAIQHLDIECRAAHCDIRPSNIVLSSNLTEVKLINLKSSRSRREFLPTIPHHTVLGMDPSQLLYCAPEYFDCLGCLGNTALCGTADVWALGVLYFVMLYGHHPLAPGLIVLDSMQKLQFVHELRHFERVQFPSTPNVSNAIKRAIEACLQRNPTARLKSSELVSTGFFNENT